MRNAIFVSFVLLWTGLLPGCSATTTTTQPGGAPSTLPNENPVPPIDEPKSSVISSAEIAPAMVRQLCLAFEVSGGPGWLQAFDDARSDDEVIKREFKKVDDWKRRDPRDPAVLADCKKVARDLSGQIGTRHVTAQSLCSFRNRGDDGSSVAIYDSVSEPTRTRMNVALDLATTSTTTAACVAKMEEAAKEFETFESIALQQCSPDSDRHAAKCEKEAAPLCTAYAEGKATAVQIEATHSACLKNGGVEMTRTAGVSSSRSTLARSPLTGPALETAILTGAADFFEARAKQELSLFASEVIGRRLCAEASEGAVEADSEKGEAADKSSSSTVPLRKQLSARQYLPRTCELLNPVGDDPVVGATPIAIRAAAKADLDALPEVIVEEIATKDRAMACGAAFAWGVSQEVAHGAALADILQDPTSILKMPLVNSHCPAQFEEIVKLARYFRAQLKGDPGAVAAALRAGDFTRQVEANPFLRAESDGLQDTVKEVLRRLVALDRAISNYNANPSPEARVTLAVAAIQVVVPIMVHLAPNAREDLYTTVDVVTQVLNHEYALAVVTASTLKVVRILPPSTRNLVSIGAGFAQAESSDDVRQTLEDAALPLGSWRRKNEERWGATLTGAVGFYGAYENVVQDASRPAPMDSEQSLEVSSGWTIAPALLVGVDFHRGFGAARFGLHFNVLDLGALGSIRFEEPDLKDEDGEDVSDADAESGPDVKVQQVFAPGLFAYGGFGPFDVGPAVTFVPSLRPVEAGGEVDFLNVIRYGIVLAVDVSVLPLF